MKRQIHAPRRMLLRLPSAPKAFEREYAQALDYMIEQATKRFANNAILAMQARTQEKFADAQTGNYASVFLALAERTRKMIIKQFDDDRIEAFTRQILGGLDKANARTFYGALEQRLGLSAAEILATEGISGTRNALIKETALWAQKLRDETLEFYTANTLRAMTTGQNIEQLMGQLSEMEGKRRDHAKFTARNQIGNYNSLVTKVRAENLGITEAVWRTAGDERVRPSHQARDGKTFELSKGLYSSADGKTLLPQIDFQCRCSYTLVIPE